MVLSRLNRWVAGLLADHGDEMYRYKGVLAVVGSDNKYIFQGATACDVCCQLASLRCVVIVSS